MTIPPLPGSAFALLTDGTQIEIRPVTPADEDAVRRLYRGLSDESLYYRFFGLNRALADENAVRLCRESGPGHAAMGAWLRGELVGVAQYEATGTAGEAEVAMAVADAVHHQGVGTLLLEHLGSCARERGVRALRAETLADNTAMLRLFADAGMPARRRFVSGVVELVIPLTVDDRYLDAVAERERRADVASLTRLFRPEAVAVVGAGRRPDSIGAAVLRAVLDGGFPGPVYAVNPHASGKLHGAPCVATVADLPVRPDLAVLTVPAAAVPQVAAQCGRRGVRALVVITSGLDAARARELRAACHRHGMRLVGPNCLGVADTAAALDATFAPRHPARGAAGVAVQSGGVGIALVEHLSRLGIGVSSFASLGDKHDVSANDLLLWWESDEATRLGVVHVESFGNPRKFARTARRVGRTMPLLTVLAGRSAAGGRAAASHTAAAATPDLTRRALFRQAGIVATDGLGELVDAAALLAVQPPPDGPAVAVVANAGGAGVLAADACADAGLTVPRFAAALRDDLAGLLPAGAATANPVDTTAAVPAASLAAAVRRVTADPSVDAVLVVTVPTALGDPAAEILTAPPSGDPASAAEDGARREKPLVVVALGQAESVRITGTGVPVYAEPEQAARALGHARTYARSRARPVAPPPELPGLHPDRAAEIISGLLSARPDGGWLAPADAFDLLDAYAIPSAPRRWARTADEAVAAAAELGRAVALKADAAGALHKTAAGAVRLGLVGREAVRRAFTDLADRFGGELRGVLVQAMVDRSVETLCGVVSDEIFGPVIVFGSGGVDADALADRSARLAPLSAGEADELVAETRIGRLLAGGPGRPPGDAAALRDLLLRLSRLAADHPRISELDLNPTLVRADGVLTVDVRVRIAPIRVWDPYLRRLRTT
ncbi:GNAT family N-acetyltransferase [Actinomadura gamaensis]|uniref:GNAT family N-acetyltransferase n=1 Tax=Actinomadura gamaensis TaxID=1763541 RepID=A0ABV9TSR5_9ACTN